MLSITKCFGFEMAHLISNYKGACAQLHGHSYKLEVTISGELDEDMIMDFKQLKKLVNKEVLTKLDHRLVLKENHRNIKRFALSGEDIWWFPFEPTAERLTLWIAEKVKTELPAGIELLGIRLYETATCYADWNKDEK